VSFPETLCNDLEITSKHTPVKSISGLVRIFSAVSMGRNRGMMVTSNGGDQDRIIPALGRNGLTWAYDFAIALATREHKWRNRLAAAVAPGPEDKIVDLGCGTGTLAIMLKRRQPQAHIIGLDPDPEVLLIARRKMERAGMIIELFRADAGQIAEIVKDPVDKIVSSLVFHHLALEKKQATLKGIFTALRPGGGLYLTDYGLQRSRLMRSLFRVVQTLDGFETTQPNADGVLPQLMIEAGFEGVTEASALPTLTGSISFYEAHRPWK
jgi:ubiquinone/menaquinone biosynthesis C-methylase UbiE